VSFADADATSLLQSSAPSAEHLRRGEPVSATRKPQGARGAYLRALAADATAARLLGLGCNHVDARYQATASYPLQIVPDDHSFRYISLIYVEEHNDFLKLNYVNRDLRYEDFNLGLTFGAAFAVSPQGLGAPRTTFRVRTGWVEASGWEGKSFVLGRIDFETRPTRERRASPPPSWVRKYETATPQTTVVRLSSTMVKSL
jgi:hypothetical protein